MSTAAVLSSFSYSQPAPVSPSVMYDQFFAPAPQPSPLRPSLPNVDYLQTLQQALQQQDYSSHSYRPSYVPPQPKPRVPEPKVAYVPEELVIRQGRALFRVTGWNVAQQALKEKEKVVGFFTDDGGCTYFCPVITNEAEMQYFLQRFAPQVVAMVGLGQGPNDTPHPLIVKPIFYALVC